MTTKSQPNYRKLILDALDAGGKRAKGKGGNAACVDRLLADKYASDPAKVRSWWILAQ